MVENENGNRTINDWLMHLDNKLTNIADKLDSKADRETVAELESRTNRLAVKQAGISGTMIVVMGYFKYLITGNW